MTPLKLSVFLPLILLGACGEAAKSVEYYSQNAKEAATVINNCPSGDTPSLPNCQNAKLGHRLMLKRQEAAAVEKLQKMYPAAPNK